MINREEWLTACLAALRLTFARWLPGLPARIRVSCGWTYHVRERRAGGRASPHARAPEVARTADGSGRKQRVGPRKLSESFGPEHSADGTAEVFISPEVADPLHVAGLLLHELIHLASRRESHDQVFQRLARSVGFVEPFAEARPNEALQAWLNHTCVKLGPYPHAKMDDLKQPVTRTSRAGKLLCHKCFYFVWTTTRFLRLGPPPEHCGRPMRERPAKAAV